MFRTISSVSNVAKDEEIVDAPLPILGPIDRTEPELSEQTIIVRDFAYSAENILFWRLEELPDCETPLHSSKFGQDPSSNPVSQLGHVEEGGFTGTPPWLQSASDGDLSEEELAALNPDDELHGRAVALFDFTPEHENEFALLEGQVIYISSRHGLGWLVAVDIHNGDCGLVPEEYVRLLEAEEEGFSDHEPDSNLTATALSSDTVKTSGHADDGFEDGDQDGTSDWVDEPGSVDSSLDQMSHKSRESPAAEKVRTPRDLTDAERQEILDAAEREMALNDARFRQEI